MMIGVDIREWQPRKHQNHQPVLGWLAAATMGSCLGFLPYNFRITSVPAARPVSSWGTPEPPSSGSSWRPWL